MNRFSIIDWNIGGARYLEKADDRDDVRRHLNQDLQSLIHSEERGHHGLPHVIALQEIVQYREPGMELVDLIDTKLFPRYNYYPFPLIDSDRLSSKGKWNKVQKLGGWRKGTYFAQGNAFLVRNDTPHCPVWDLSRPGRWPRRADGPERPRHYIEQVDLQSGLYFGTRDTEPRAALVAHFILDSTGCGGKPLDVFVVNLHLTTLTMEREGIPEIDVRASQIRLAQLRVVFDGIVSRYNTWAREGFTDRGKKRRPERHETLNRCNPVWILVGDFNFTESSEEYEWIGRMNFLDAIPDKHGGTKSRGVGSVATTTLDYIFAGPKFISFNPVIAQQAVERGLVEHRIEDSDHFPCLAAIPLDVPAK
ncbi:MAG TPA: endonuclease/exonuclease/phosphatase family protein [bacterium]|nr:endonuclease/exonuclease/phosphatase family protein [bacterium]